MNARRALVLLAVLLAGALPAGCGHPVPAVARVVSDGQLPRSAPELERLIIPTVPSRLPRMPDDAVVPPAGGKGLDDVARYAKDAAREREVLRRYGYRFGWERYWGRSAGSTAVPLVAMPMTSVFVYQFGDWTAASVYSRDLAANEAEYYRGMLEDDPPDLPGACRLLRVDGPSPSAGLRGPAAFAWCAHGVFSVSVSAVSDTPQAARAEVVAALRAQLRRLPAG